MFKRHLSMLVPLLILTALGLLLSKNPCFSEKAQKKLLKPPLLQTHQCEILPKNSHHGVCQHCGCRMKISQEELEKACTVCKCGKKNKECILKKS